MAGLGPAWVLAVVLALGVVSAEATAQVMPRGAPAGGAAEGLLIDPANGCGTSNPIPRLGETIRWRGGCREGLLDGAGTLMWFQDGKVREKNEGTFLEGELEGQATTTFADGSVIIGKYSRGTRHGEFVIRRNGGSNVRALYAQGKLISERELSDEELRAFRDGKYRPAPIEAANAAVAQAAAAQPAPVYAPAPAPAYVPSAPIQVAQPAVQVAAPARLVPGNQYPAGSAPGVPWAPPPTGLAPQAIPAAQAAGQGSIVPPWSPRAINNPAAAGNIMVAGMPAPLPVPAPVPTPAFVAAAAPVPMQVPAPMPFQPQMVAPAGRVAMLGGSDQALNEAMLLERAGRNDEAASLYAEIAAITSGTPTGLLAAERAGKLRAPGDRPAAYQNAPLPLAGTTVLANSAQRAPLNGKFVCSARDIFDNNANWCGRAIREEGNDVEVEIRSLKFNRLFAVGFSAAPCTGGRFLGPFAEGTKIWVSRGCLEGNP